MSIPPHGRPGETRSTLSDSTARDVVQARDISGGLHFHPLAESAVRIPRQLPGDVPGFVNQVSLLDRLDAVLAAHQNDQRTRSFVVITGTAGVGKTSLVVHWAHRVYETFP